MSVKTKIRKKYFILVCILILAFAGTIYYYLFSTMTIDGKSHFIYVDSDDDVDSVIIKVSDVSQPHTVYAFKTLLRHSSYPNNIRTGRYEIKPSNGAFVVFRKVKSGMQSPVVLTIPSVRTVDQLVEFLSSKLMLSKSELQNALTDNNICKKYGYTPETIMCMFIPNTYDIYWNISVKNLLDKMNKESKRFWNYERINKAKSMGLSPVEVITLASIVDEETANNEEKPMIAGMYYNRLKVNMPLQADPTIKFALKKFELKRIYQDMLSINSPYNTYKNIGLPPGPIRIPSVKGIDAVLNYVHHNYMYMCAKEDFSGTHNFAKTYSEHLQNAAKYTKALNSKGIN